MPGTDSHLDADHTNTKTFTVYSDGKIYVRIEDTLQKGSEVGPTRSKSSFIHPINAKSYVPVHVYRRQSPPNSKARDLSTAPPPESHRVHKQTLANLRVLFHSM